MLSRKKINDIILEQVYTLSFENAPDKYKDQALEGQFVLQLAKLNKQMDAHDLTIKVRRKKDSKSLFVYVNDKYELECDPDKEEEYSKHVIDDINESAKKFADVTLSDSDIKQFADKNEKQAFEYLIGAKFQIDDLSSR